MTKRRVDARSGFTLLELLMVVIIIAILAALALPQYFRTVERSRTAQVLQLLGSIRSSELRFKAQSPTNLYENTVGLPGLDITLPTVIPSGWDVPTVTGTGAGSNVVINRNGGPDVGADLIMDLDGGVICASTTAAVADWGLPAGVVAC